MYVVTLIHSDIIRNTSIPYTQSQPATVIPKGWGSNRAGHLEFAWFASLALNQIRFYSIQFYILYSIRFYQILFDSIRFYSILSDYHNNQLPNPSSAVTVIFKRIEIITFERFDGGQTCESTCIHCSLFRDQHQRRDMTHDKIRGDEENNSCEVVINFSLVRDIWW